MNLYLKKLTYLVVFQEILTDEVGDVIDHLQQYLNVKIAAAPSNERTVYNDTRDPSSREQRARDHSFYKNDLSKHLIVVHKVYPYESRKGKFFTCEMCPFRF